MSEASTPHWAGWGAPGSHPLPEHALTFLAERLGKPLPHTPAVAFDDVRLLDSRLDAADRDALAGVVGAEQVHADRAARITHAGGKSYLDLVRLRSGDAGSAPDAVVTPADHDEVQQLLAVCSERRIAVVPFGGGTSVVGGVTPHPAAHRAVIALDLARLDALREVDPVSQLAVAGAGLRGPRLERALAAHGLRLGHLPQSFEFATVGGYAATRSAGQASTGIGRFDDLVQAVRVATPAGGLRVGHPPASAAGPDLRALLVGSEGAFGVITEVTLRVRPVAEASRFAAYAMGSFAAGQDALRALVQEGVAVDVTRLSDAAETEVSLALAGLRGARAAAVRGYLAARGLRRPCLLIAGVEGSRRAVARRHADADRVLRRAGAVRLGTKPAAAWVAGRFSGAYHRDALLDRGVLVETLETATTWSRLDRLYTEVRTALDAALAGQGTPPLVMCHVSHCYPTGASLYFTVFAAQRRGSEAEQWPAAKRAATDAIVRHGGTVTHHHAVGADHAPWLADEIGDLGVGVLRAVKARLDPAGILNPGTLLPAVEAVR